MTEQNDTMDCEKIAYSDSPTYMGASCDQGEIVIDPIYPNEGYAIIKCGGTSIKVGYTVLNYVVANNHGQHPFFTAISELNMALNAIKCEAMVGNTGD